MKLSEKVQLHALLKKLCAHKARTNDCNMRCVDCHVQAVMSELPAKTK